MNSKIRTLLYLMYLIRNVQTLLKGKLKLFIYHRKNLTTTFEIYPAVSIACVLKILYSRGSKND